VASTAFAFVVKMSEKHRSTSPSAIQVKNWWKTISTDEKLEKGELIVYICCKVKKRRLCQLAVM